MTEGRYVLRRPSPNALAPLLIVPIAIVLIRVILDARIPVRFFGFLAAAALVNAWRASLLLRVDGDGVRLGRGMAYRGGGNAALTIAVPWRDVAAVVVFGDEPSASGCGPKAPLPAGLGAVDRGADGRAEIPAGVRVSIPPGRLDLTALDAAVRGSGDGAVVERA